MATDPLNQWGRVIRSWAISKGWRSDDHNTRTVGEDCALIVSEVSEMLEAYRDNKDTSAVWYTYTVEVSGVKFPNMNRDQLCILLGCEDDELDDHIDELNLKAKPEGFGPELADTLIRLFDVGAQYGLDIEALVREKMEHNRPRPHLHGCKNL